MSEKFIGEQDGFTFVEVQGLSIPGDDVRVYRMYAPKFTGNIYAPRELDNWGLRDLADRVADQVVDEILDNPKVEKEVNRRLRAARYAGYYGRLEEERSGVRFDLEGVQ